MQSPSKTVTVIPFVLRLFALLVGFLACSVAGKETSNRPDLPLHPIFVLVLADDLGYGDPGRCGSTRNTMPHIDTPPRRQWLCRLPENLRSQLNIQAEINALSTAGVELGTVLLGDWVSVTLDAPHGQVPLEIWWGDFMAGVMWITPEPTVIELSTPPRMSELRTIANDQGSPWSPEVLRLVMPFGGTVRLIQVSGASKGLVLRHDNGLIFGSRLFRGLVSEYGLTQEYITPYTPEENDLCERFIRSFKEECIWQNRFASLPQGRTAIVRWIENYNTQ